MPNPRTFFDIEIDGKKGKHTIEEEEKKHNQIELHDSNNELICY